MTTSATDGVVRVQANHLQKGHVLKIEADGLTSGSAVNVIGSSALSAYGKLFSIDGRYATEGTLLNINAKAMKNGAGLKISGGSNLQSGASLLSLESQSGSPNGVFRLTSACSEGNGHCCG